MVEQKSFESIFFEKLSEQTKIPIENLRTFIQYNLDDFSLSKKPELEQVGINEILAVLTARSLTMGTHYTSRERLVDSFLQSDLLISKMDEIIDSMGDFITIKGGGIGSINRHYDLTPAGLQKGLEVLKTMSENKQD